MENKSSLREIIEQVNKNKRYPALQLVKDNLVGAAVISKLVTNQSGRDFNIDSDQSSNQINTASIKYLAHTILDNKRGSANMMELFPDIEIAIQILVSSILSPKDMTNTDLIYKVNNSFLSSEITGAIINVVKKAMESEYRIVEDLPKILRQTLFEAGSYATLVIPENSLDELINRSQYISKEALENTIIKNGNIKPLWILGNSFTPTPELADRPNTGISLEAFGSPSFGSPRDVYNPQIGSQRLIDGVMASTGPNKEIMSEIVKWTQYVTVTDNYNVCKLPKMVEHNSRMKIKHRIATESPQYPGYNIDVPVNRRIEDLVYKTTANRTIPFVALKTKDTAARNPIGRPLVLNIPSEAIVPVYTPGDETNHIGYFVMIDGDGHPLNKNSLDMSNIDNMNGTTFMNANMNSPDLSNFITNKTAYNLNGSPTSGMNSKELTSVFASIIENDLINRLQNGLYKTKLEISKVDEIYRIMLQRALASQQTQLLFVPAEQMTYFAYKYHPNGVGKSLMEDVRVLNSLRAMTMFARIMASIRNSVGVTEVRMKLDEKDPDPQKSMEMTMHEIMKTRQQFFPLGINSPSDLAEWIQRSGFQFTFEGHPKIPDMHIDFEQKGYTNVKPDDELDAELKKRSILAFGLSPETVDNGFAAEFATTVVANNLLLSKRVMQIQQVFMPILTNYIRQLVKNDMIIYNEILSILDSNQKSIAKTYTEDEKSLMTENKYEFYNLLVDKFLDLFEVSLPSPSTSTIDTQMSALTQYTDALDKALSAWISTEGLTSNLVGVIADDVDMLKDVIKSYYIRKWMTENNVLPELNDLTLADEDGNPRINLFDIQKDHMEGLLNTASKFIEEMHKVRDKLDKKIGETSDSTQAELGEPDDTAVSSDIEEAGEVGVDDVDLAGDGSTDDNNPDTLGTDTEIKKEDEENLDDI